MIQALRVYARFINASASPTKSLSIFTPDSAKEWPSLRNSETGDGWDVKLTEVMATVANRMGDGYVNGVENFLTLSLLVISHQMKFSHYMCYS